jgi:hypothetical protein
MTFSELNVKDCLLISTKDSLGDMHDDVTSRAIGRHTGRVAPASQHRVPIASADH